MKISKNTFSVKHFPAAGGKQVTEAFPIMFIGFCDSGLRVFQRKNKVMHALFPETKTLSSRKTKQMKHGILVSYLTTQNLNFN